MFNSNTPTDKLLKIADLATERASDLVGSGVDGLREASHQMRVGAHHASVKTARFMKEDPMRAFLIAAATGAALMALLGLLAGPRARK